MQLNTKLRILEFVVAGLIIDLTENIITVKFATHEPITPSVILIAFVVVIPFAVITELVIDHPLFWPRVMAAIKKVF